MDRRHFIGASATSLGLSGLLTATSSTGAEPFEQASAKSSLRVGVIGSTGRGNYGHGLDVAWRLRPDLFEVVAVAGSDSTGLAKEISLLGDVQGFADYHSMLEKIRPDIVAICPRHPDQHHDMIMTAIQYGAQGIYCEKPFCRTPMECDEVLAAAETRNVKIAVGHRNRYHPVLFKVKDMLDAGAIGNVLEIRGRGKGDRRGGSEDLWVLGTHVFNVMHYLCGRPVSCSAFIKRQGHLISSSDVIDGNEALGPLAGDEVHARFEMENGLVAYFDSLANDRTNSKAFGLQVVGSNGIIDIKIDVDPLAQIQTGNPYELNATPWLPISTAGPGVDEPREGLFQQVSSHEIAIADLADAIHSNREPLCCGRDAAITVEMVHAVFASHRFDGACVKFPLTDRGHQLSLLKAT